ncbi:MAG TPA: PaaX family transcriptional regulator C-terminal domain-containing protein [Polyangiaceae bacterium]|nr:PaaX family transcriptional regulator C-terminal domain-containing protein [Polyangiaceae bacterium]
MGPSAKSVLLELLVAARGQSLPVRLAVVACELFDISENNVRVAIVRLSSSGLIVAAGRGLYRLGPGAEGIAREVSSFRTVEKRLRSWNGGWIAVHVGALSRSDRTVLRRRARSLSLLGFAELERGLHVRPDNLDGGVEDVRARLRGLGLDERANVFAASAFDADVDARARALWDGKALTQSYRKTRTEIERWLRQAGRLETDVAAREAFLLGGRGIRQVVYDPLLPPPLVDVEERHAFVRAVVEMDGEGRKIWQRFFRENALAASEDFSASIH